MAEVASEDLFCEIQISPRQELVGSITDFVVGLSARYLMCHELSGRLEVAVHELVDNAVRYSADGVSSVAFELKRRAPGKVHVAIHTRNRADDTMRAELASLFEEMRNTADRCAFYQILLRRTAKRAEGSGLGLGRIHSEVNMDLSFEIEGDLVHLRAETNVDAPASGDHV